jgi:UDP-N-acetylglucosamine--N-acetylmuramyl-(pentapeptide) pyrophosphoryl-undecaprenol N-acetylglucosamine transferase
MEKKRKCIVLSAGGTGGHLFPALNLAKQLQDKADICFISGGALNALSSEINHPFHEVKCSPLKFQRPLQVLKAVPKIVRGVYKSFRLFQKYKPDLVIGFGSYFTFPVLLAAWCRGIPLVLHEQNAFPGKVNRLFSSYATYTAITFPEAQEHLKGEAQHVLFPSKEQEELQREECFRYFELDPQLPTLLVYGGSSGALGLNTLILKSLVQLKRLWGPFQVIHCVGKQEDQARVKAHYTSAQVPVCLRPFEKHLERALFIADVAVTRAGSGTVNELIEFALPSVLIPYPNASENHQEKNALHFIQEVKGGEYYKEGKVDPQTIAHTIVALFKNREILKSNIQSYKKSLPKEHLKHLILKELDDKKT